MASEHSNSEKAIWEIYLERCRQNGTQPSVDDFRAWLQVQMKGMWGRR